MLAARDFTHPIRITGTKLPSKHSHKVQHCQHQLPNASTAWFCWYRAHGQHPNLTIFIGRAAVFGQKISCDVKKVE